MIFSWIQFGTMDKLTWCLKKKRGVKIIEPNENLYKAYLLKSKEALESMNINFERKILSWAISASYYARYFAVYALLSKIGIKSEVHDCTIELFKFLFIDTNKINIKFYKELKEAKDYRVEAQYYFPDFKNLRLQSTREFVLEIEKLAEQITEKDISELRRKLESLL